METPQAAKVRAIVEFVRQSGCWFDPGDAAEDLFGVLGEYGLVEEGLDADGAAQLALELECMAAECQAGEIALQVSLGEQPSGRVRERLRYED